jgi:hypothetical protein
MAQYFSSISDSKFENNGSAFDKYFVSEQKHRSPNVNRILTTINRNLRETKSLDKQLAKNLSTFSKDVTSNVPDFKSKGIRDYANFVQNNSLPVNNILISDVKSSTEAGLSLANNRLLSNYVQPREQSVGESMLSTAYNLGMQTAPAPTSIISAGLSSIGLSSTVNNAVESGVSNYSLSGITSGLQSVVPIAQSLLTLGKVAYGAYKLFASDEPDPKPTANDTTILSTQNKPASNEISRSSIENLNFNDQPLNVTSTNENEIPQNQPDQDPTKHDNPNTGPAKPGDPTESILPDDSTIENKVELAPTRFPLDLSYNANNTLAFSGNTSTSRMGYNSNFKRRKF